MPRSDQAECRALLLRDTDLAILVAPIHSPIGGQSWWIPRSQIGYMRKTKVESPFEGSEPSTHVVFTVPEWLVESKQFWQLVP